MKRSCYELLKKTEEKIDIESESHMLYVFIATIADELAGIREALNCRKDDGK